MYQVFQSSFLQALGFAIANSLWQTALVWLLFLLANRAVSFSAQAKYRLAVTAQLISFAWFLITLRFYYTAYSHAWQHTGSLSGDTVINDGNSYSLLISTIMKAEQILPYISMAYLLLMILLVSRLVLGYRQTALLRSTGLLTLSVNWQNFVDKSAAGLGIGRQIGLFLSEAVHSPLTIGFIKPIILLPIASINHLSTDQLEAVLLHELAHIKRYDYLWNMLLSVIEITLFFNPFTQLISRVISKERENSCDDWVLQFKYEASVYAEALLKIACLQATPAFAMAASGKKNDLLMRVKRMINRKENVFSYRKQLLAFLMVSGLLCTVAWLNPITSPQRQLHSGSIPTKKTIHEQSTALRIEPMAIQVENPLFNPVFFLAKPLQEQMKKDLAKAEKELSMEKIEPEKGAIENMAAAIPPMVANALEQASQALSDKKEAMSEEPSMTTQKAKAIAEKNLSSDSSMTRSARKNLTGLKTEMAQSLKEMNAGIRKAKQEMDVAFKTIPDIQIDKEKIRKDIKNALDELSSIELNQLVSAAMDIPAIIFGREDESSQKAIMNKKIASEKREVHLRKPAIRKDIEEEDDLSIAQNRNKQSNQITEPLTYPVQAPSSQLQIEKMKQKIASMIKLQQLKKQAAEKSITVVPVLFSAKKAQEKTENEILIILQ